MTLTISQANCIKPGDVLVAQPESGVQFSALVLSARSILPVGQVTLKLLIWWKATGTFEERSLPFSPNAKVCIDRYRS